MSRRPARSSGRLCVYCQIRPGTEGDHVPPRGFFSTSDRAGMSIIKVPCCPVCNRAQTNAEEQFRDVLAMVRGTASDEVYQRFLRSLTNLPPKRARIMQAVTRRRGRLVYSTLKKNYRDMFVKVVKGLYFHEFGKPVPRDYWVDAWLEPRDAGQRYRQTQGATVRQLAPSFRYVFVGGPDTSIWWFDFDAGPSALATIQRPTLLARLERALLWLTGGRF